MLWSIIHFSNWEGPSIKKPLKYGKSFVLRILFTLEIKSHLLKFSPISVIFDILLSFLSYPMSQFSLLISIFFAFPPILRHIWPYCEWKIVMKKNHLVWQKKTFFIILVWNLKKWFHVIMIILSKSIKNQKKITNNNLCSLNFQEFCIKCNYTVYATNFFSENEGFKCLLETSNIFCLDHFVKLLKGKV